MPKLHSQLWRNDWGTATANRSWWRWQSLIIRAKLPDSLPRSSFQSRPAFPKTNLLGTSVFQPLSFDSQAACFLLSSPLPVRLSLVLSPPTAPLSCLVSSPNPRHQLTPFVSLSQCSNAKRWTKQMDRYTFCWTVLTRGKERTLLHTHNICTHAHAGRFSMHFSSYLAWLHIDEVESIEILWLCKKILKEIVKWRRSSDRAVASSGWCVWKAG